MNRKHTRDDYLELVRRIRAARADIALSTDIIVGFPGETDEEFIRTLEVVKSIQFAQAYSFKFSPRPGTPAAAMDDQVPEEVKSSRLQELQAVLNEQQAAFNASCVGRKLEVLFERPGRRSGQLVGRSPYLQAVHADGPESLIGNIIEVEIISAGPNSLEADIVNAADSAVIAAE
jgi:tRNA-2-methylthio-N6-dimethylallyladenosine synthase